MPARTNIDTMRSPLFEIRTFEHLIFGTQFLTLNVTVPNLDDGGLLPVLVFVQGGGSVTGSSSLPQSDLGVITDVCVEIVCPIIPVSVK